MLETARVAARPEDAGIDPEKLEALFERAQGDVDAGLLPSAQVAVARRITAISSRAGDWVR